MEAWVAESCILNRVCWIASFEKIQKWRRFLKNLPGVLAYHDFWGKENPVISKFVINKVGFDDKIQKWGKALQNPPIFEIFTRKSWMKLLPQPHQHS